MTRSFPDRLQRQVQETLEDVERAEHRLAARAEKVGARAQDLADDLAKRGRRATKEVIETARERPLVVIGSVALAAAIVGFIVGRASNAR